MRDAVREMALPRYYEIYHPHPAGVVEFPAGKPMYIEH
jgi:hypothetical protein